MLRTCTGSTRLCRALWTRPLFNSSFSSKTPSPSPSATPHSAKKHTPSTNLPITPSLEEHHDENAVYELRTKMLKEWEAKSGKVPYPVHQPTTHTIPQFREAFNYLKNGEKAEGQSVSVAGRIINYRDASTKLTFYDITSGGAGLQVMATLARYSSPEEYAAFRHFLRKGDTIHIKGIPARTGTGELSIIPTHLNLVAPCLRLIPSSLTLKETRYRNRHLDLLANPSVKHTFITRAKMISFLRNYLDSRGFLEVETPILSTEVGGANARPFLTHSNALNIPLHLRIAPELYLKKLVIGGFDRVYEIGKQFRNEGIDSTHNPEFATCEFYQAYSDYEEVMAMTEHLLHEMVTTVTGSPKITIPVREHHDSDTHSPPPSTSTPPPSTSSPTSPSLDAHSSSPSPSSSPASPSTSVTVDFTPPFPRISFVSKLQEILGDEFPSNFNSYESIPQLVAICVKHKIPHPPPQTPARLLDALFSHFIEPLCIQPTFVIDHPLVLSPLAKLHRNNKALVERFELIVGGKEIVNAYSELNDPHEQRSRFLDQMKDRQQGDVEAQAHDESFCEALEYGLPATGGWGIGLDRLCMMLTNTNSIKDVLLFPTMKPKS